MLYSTDIPAIVNSVAIAKAVFTDILPEGTGLFLVRSINLSRSLSIIWLKAFEAPTIKYPPIARSSSVLIETVSTPNK
jgi:hypothetical protein